MIFLWINPQNNDTQQSKLELKWPYCSLVNDRQIFQ